MEPFPTTSDIGAGYDAAASAYAAEFGDELDRKPFDRELLTRFAAATAGRGMVADIGGGPGHVAAFLSARGVEACGIDLSTGMTAIARERHPDIPVAAADMRALGVAGGSLVGITAFYSLIHLPRAHVVRALIEFRRVLQPEGRLLLAVHAGEGAVYRDRWYDRPVNMAATLFAADEMEGYLARAGFTVEQTATRLPYDFEYETDRIYTLSRPSR